MANRVEAQVKLINDKIKFVCRAKDNAEIVTDYIPPLGNNEGYMPLEVFLISLAACTSGTILPLMRAMRKTISGFDMKISGERRDAHPTCFDRIVMDMVIRSNDLENGDVAKALKLAEETYCPVWAMIKNNVAVETRYRILKN